MGRGNHTKSKTQKALEEGQLDLLGGVGINLPPEVKRKVGPLQIIKIPKVGDDFHLWVQSCVAPVLQFTLDSLALCDESTRARLGTEMVRILTQYKPPEKKVELHNHTHLPATEQSKQLGGFLFIDPDED
jgi:hypothetical protein